MTNRQLNDAPNQANELIATLYKEKEVLEDEIAEMQALLDDIAIREANANKRLLESTMLLFDGVRLLADEVANLNKIPKFIRWIFGAK